MTAAGVPTVPGHHTVPGAAAACTLSTRGYYTCAPLLDPSRQRDNHTDSRHESRGDYSSHLPTPARPAGLANVVDIDAVAVEAMICLRPWHLQIDCPLCHRKLANRSNLRRHMRSRHSTERPFACPHCPLRFPDSSNRKKHQVTCEQQPVMDSQTAAQPSAATQAHESGRAKEKTCRDNKRLYLADPDRSCGHSTQATSMSTQPGDSLVTSLPHQHLTPARGHSHVQQHTPCRGSNT